MIVCNLMMRWHFIKSSTHQVVTLFTACLTEIKWYLPFCFYHLSIRWPRNQQQCYMVNVQPPTSLKVTMLRLHVEWRLIMEVVLYTSTSISRLITWSKPVYHMIGHTWYRCGMACLCDTLTKQGMWLYILGFFFCFQIYICFRFFLPILWLCVILCITTTAATTKTHLFLQQYVYGSFYHCYLMHLIY